MDTETERFVLDILASHYLLTLATNREDGWPQATTVGYVNDGLTLYVMTFPQAQKVANIRRDPRVSLTIDREDPDWNQIKGLSMAATAEIVQEPAEIQRVGGLMIARFPQIKDMPQPEPGDVTVLRIKPKIISVLNYEKGFGHTDLVEV